MSDKHHDLAGPQGAGSGLSGRCPRCGRGKLFSGYLSLRERCDVCGLDYSFADSADGPAVFVILLVGFIVVGAALGVEFAYRPPYWVHAVLWLPLLLVLSLGLLRVLKSWMVVQQYRHAAREGRLDRGDGA
ncbi:MAG: DUF983 domain-containing protein [Rhodobiaceae bacterium]|nr:DUF983 domain-containing protein [Rhodobiaceae bacterium]MCC0015919.1 DUF983 domain-containing protein [Rhodobiaceae bacterium]MCC0040704.1 DUF983 domain-containing protein [Rhodobiaceae bacterium]